MKNIDAPQVALAEFSHLHPYVYAVCEKHVSQYGEDKVHGVIREDGPWQCDNCPDDGPAAYGKVYAVTE